MTLLDQLRKILGRDDVLPMDPANAVMGSDLLEKVRPLLTEAYSDNSIRQTFSALAGDPTSPIARIEEGYGYYRRVLHAAPDQAPLSTSEQATPLVTTPAAGGRDTQLEEKFRAFFMRHEQMRSAFPVHVEHTAGARQPLGVNKWKFPDVVVLNWEVGEQSDDGFVLDPALLEVKRSLGEQPFRLSSVELKVELSLASFREHFFQCVSNSKWAHAAQLVVATAVSDALLAQELRRLGASYGVTVIHFGLTREQLEGLPPATDIARMSDGEFEKIMPNAGPTQVAVGATRGDLDWDHIRDMRSQSSEFRELFEWVARCLRDARAYSIRNYRSLLQIEKEAG